MGWHTCCLSLFNVLDPIKRQQAVEEIARGELEANWVPGVAEVEDESAQESDSDNEEDEVKDVLDILKERQFGARKSDRKRTQTSMSGYVVNSQQVAYRGDSEA